MKTKVSPTAVGMFVLGALALGVIALLSFGGLSLFSKPQRFMVYFNESIPGLDLGSPVKLQGVRVGRVVELVVRYDDKANRSVVVVTCELNRNVITDPQGVQLKVTGPQDIEAMVGHGLRAQLGVLGLATGLLFVELDFLDPAQYPAPKLADAPKFVVIPSIPSAISEYSASVSEILSDLKKVDFAGLSKNLKVLLDTTNQKVGELDLKGLGDKMGAAADAVKGFVNSPEARQTFLNLNAALTDLRVVLARLDGNIGPVSDELKKTLADAQGALQSVQNAADTTQRFVTAQGSLGDEATQSLRQLSDAAAALERLSDALSRNPSSLIVGKKKSEPAKP